jgi:HSP20 family protein
MAEKPQKEAKSVARWDPFREIEEFTRGWPFPFREFPSRRRFGRLLDEIFGELPAARGALAPALDITESENEYVVTVELPGVKKEDLSVELNEGVLSIHGEKKSEREEKKERTHWVERSYGSFSRAFTLPPNVAGDRIDASFQDGVLTLRLAKAEAAKPKTIAVK